TLLWAFFPYRAMDLAPPSTVHGRAAGSGPAASGMQCGSSCRQSTVRSGLAVGSSTEASQHEVDERSHLRSRAAIARIDQTHGPGRRDESRQHLHETSCRYIVREHDLGLQDEAHAFE